MDIQYTRRRTNLESEKRNWHLSHAVSWDWQWGRVALLAPGTHGMHLISTDGFQCERWQFSVEVRLPQADAATDSPSGDIMESGGDTMGRYGGNGARF